VIEHLLELRKRLLRYLLVLLGAFALCFWQADSLFRFLAHPLQEALGANASFVFIAPHEAFFTYLRLSLFAAFFFTFPWLLAEAWAFVVPGLYEHERRWFTPLLFAAAVLFYAGAAFAYWGVFPFAFRFFFSFAGDGIAALPSLKETLSLSLKMLFAFGVAFEIPLALLLLLHFGIVTRTRLEKARGYVVLLLFVLAAILTPPDVVTQLLLAFPMWLLFELTLLAHRLIHR